MCSVSAARSLEHCHLGERFRECSFDNFDKSYEETAYKTALTFAKNFPENDGSGLILVDPAGTGKTYFRSRTIGDDCTDYRLREYLSG